MKVILRRERRTIQLSSDPIAPQVLLPRRSNEKRESSFPHAQLPRNPRFVGPMSERSNCHGKMEVRHGCHFGCGAGQCESLLGRS